PKREEIAGPPPRFGGRMMLERPECLMNPSEGLRIGSVMDRGRRRLSVAQSSWSDGSLDERAPREAGCCHLVSPTTAPAECALPAPVLSRSRDRWDKAVGVYRLVGPSPRSVLTIGVPGRAGEIPFLRDARPTPSDVVSRGGAGRPNPVLSGDGLRCSC